MGTKRNDATTEEYETPKVNLTIENDDDEYD